MNDYGQAIAGWLKDPNVQAFLRVLREGESSQDDARAYRMRWPGKTFDDLSQHPRIFEPGPNGRSSAAGAYQITATTYDDFAPRLGVDDFSPETQDLIAAAIIHHERALLLISDGHIVEAIQRLGGRWASLPSSMSGQPTVKLQRLLDVFRKYGGKISGDSPAEPPQVQQPAGATPPVTPSPAPLSSSEPVPAPAAPQAKEPTMPAVAPIILAAGQVLYPIVADLFRKHGSKTATRNAEIVEQAAPALVELAKEVTGQPTAEQAVQAVQVDVSKREAFRAAVADDIDRLIGAIARLVEIDDASMDRAAARAKGDDAINESTPLLIRGALLGVGTVFLSLLLLMGAQVYLTPEHKPMEALVVLFVSVVGQIIGFAAAIYMYRFGSSAGSKASGDAVRAIAEQRK